MLDAASQNGTIGLNATAQTCNELDLIKTLVETADLTSSRLKKVRGSHNALDMDTESVASKALQREADNSIRLC